MTSSPDQARTLRCAQLIETMAMGGAEQLAVRVADGLARRGHESHLVVMTEPGPLSACVPDRVHVHYLGFERSSVRRPPAFLASVLGGSGRLSALLAEQRIEVLQTHLPGANFWGLLLTWRSGISIVPTVHNNREFQYGDHDLPLLAWLRRTAYRLMLRRCAGMVAVSAGVRDSLVDQLGESDRIAARIAVIPNAVPLPEPISPVVRAEVRARFGVADDETFLLAAGRFGPQKNFGDLVSAASILRDRGDAFRLVIAGDGEERESLCERVVAEGLDGLVVLPGNLQDLDDIMAAADVFVMSSLWEGLPLVLLEAMAAGLPVVAYDIPGIGEVLRDDESGLPVAKESTAALAEGLQRLVADRDLRRAMGQAARNTIRTEYNFDTMLGRIESCYRRSLR